MYLYEFWLTSINIPKYKFRVFWIYYGMKLYPATIKLEEHIANELGLNTTFTVEKKNALLLN